MTTNNVALDHIERLAKENAKLRARLAAADAVIAALPRCEFCDRVATTWDDPSYTYSCDECDGDDGDDLHYAAPLRAYRALVGEDKQ